MNIGNYYIQIDGVVTKVSTLKNKTSRKKLIKLASQKENWDKIIDNGKKPT